MFTRRTTKKFATFARGNNKDGFLLGKDWFKEKALYSTPGNGKTKNDSILKRNRKEGEDVYGARYRSMMEDEADVEAGIREKINYFNFNKIYMDTLPLYLDDVNIVNIENENTFHKVPKLAHHLDIIV